MKTLKKVSKVSPKKIIMSKIVHPYAHRLIILRDWKSHWFADPKKYCDYLKGDVLIREYLEKNYVVCIFLQLKLKGIKNNSFYY